MGSVSIQILKIPDIKESVFSYDIAGEASLFDLLNAWGAKNAPGLPKRVFDNETGGIASTILVLRNGRSVKSEDPRTTIVAPGDSITITPIIVGG